jgi:hypothetical protein
MLNKFPFFFLFAILLIRGSAICVVRYYQAHGVFNNTS